MKTLTHELYDQGGDPIPGKLSVAYSWDVLMQDGGVYSSTPKVYYAADGVFSVPILAADDPGIEPGYEAFTTRVSWSAIAPDCNGRMAEGKVTTKTLQVVLADPEPVSIADLDNVTPATMGGVWHGGSPATTESIQDVIGAMIVAAGGTYDDAEGTITLPSSGGDTTVQIGTVTLPEDPFQGLSVSVLADSSTVLPGGITWDSGGEPTITERMLLVFVWSGDDWVGTYGPSIPDVPTTTTTTTTAGTTTTTTTAATTTTTTTAATTTTTTTTTPFTSLSDAVLALSPVGYWKLDETSGTTAADSSGNSRDGTYMGTAGTHYTLAGTDGFYRMDAGGGGVAIPDNAAFSAGAVGLTVFCLATVQGAIANRYLVAKDASAAFEWEILQHSTGRFAAYQRTPAGTTGPSEGGPVLTTGDWDGWSAYCVAFPPENTTDRYPIYRNSGTAESSVVMSTANLGAGVNTASGVAIGKRYATSDVTGWTSGSFGHVAIFTGQLSGAQIQTLIDAAQAEGLIP